jgi:DNA-binding NarL/FixJ family response regulator
MNKIRVLLVDDHSLFREGMANILNAQPDFDVIGEANDGLEAQVKARKLVPDLILMDISMPGCDGVEATEKIKQLVPDVTIVMLTVRDEDEKLFQAIRNGAQGYLLKSIRSHELLALLRGAMRGDAAITVSAPESEQMVLTRREQEVLSLVAQGATDKEISDTLTISIHTVKSHMRNILGKLHMSHRYEAALYALHEGLIKPLKNE